MTCGSVLAESDDAGAKPAERWHGPFGGTFTANITATSEYSFAGISQTQRQPAVQPGLTYKTPAIGENVRLSAYLGAWGSNVDFPGTGPDIEVDLLGGLRVKAHDNRLSIDVGYIRYNYLAAPVELGYNYGDFMLLVGYDFDVFQINGKIRYSPNSFGNSGNAWNKRAQISVPLPFLRVNENISLKAYGTLGNQWVERYLNYGIPNNDYWYWQIGLITTLYGVDVTVAYTDTTIDIAGCGNTTNCQGRVILSVGKSF
jgi:uncharacterized protein (TIGR02001 family)